MKCGICKRPVGDHWLLVTLAYQRITQSAVFHDACVESLVSRPRFRDFRRAVEQAAWTQEQLPGFRPGDLVPPAVTAD